MLEIHQRIGEKMNCLKCGAAIEDGVEFCTNCGAEIVHGEDTSEKMEFTFNKAKQLGRLTYRQTTTKAVVSASSVDIEQTIKKFIGGEKKTNTSIMLNDITGIQVRIKFDIWDTVYAVIFAIIGFLAPVAFLGTAVCLFCAFGKEIIITTAKTHVGIPLAGFGSTGDVSKFVDACKGKK